MPELRTDWLLGRTVIVAEDRAGRPNEFGEGALAVARSTARDSAGAATESPTPFVCPFCPGQEHRTPPSVYESKDQNGQWRIRVVPNMFPAVRFDGVENLDGAKCGGTLDPAADFGKLDSTEFAEDSRYEAAAPAMGAHEVLIESARHIDRVSELSVSELHEVLAAYADRLRAWRHEGRCRYGLVFKNQGPRTGASLGHLHSQLIALPDVPAQVEAELRRAQQIYSKNGRCPYCAAIERERSTGGRIVLDRAGYVAFCPFASWQPYETWLLPHAHQPPFESQSGDELQRLSDVLWELIRKIESIVPDAAYNLLVRTAPWIAGLDACLHWRIEVLPRVASFAGLELAAGIHINPLSPEHSARHLRTA